VQSRILVSLLTCFALFASGWFDATAAQIDVRGTFSNLRYSRQGGDLLGAEIKIVPVTRPYDPARRYETAFQGALQIAEGAPSEIMIVDVRIDGDKISFTIPERYSGYGGGKFEGTLDAQAIKGRFTIGGVVGDEQRLRRGRGYWDK
jgi:hypothetical protein